MAYIGRTPDIGNFEKQVLTPDSVTTTFALTYAVGSANSLYVNYGGVPQEPQVAYSVSGGGQQIVFSEAPVTGTTLYIIYYGKQLTTPRAAGQETTKQTFAGDGSTVTFTLTDPPVVPAGIMVFVDGILQREGSGNNYVSSGSTISFTSAPDSSAEIDVYTLVKEKVSIDTVADGSITVTKLAASHPTWNSAGDFTFPLTGSRIRGDFSTGTDANRLSFQSSTTNGFTQINAIPNGTSQVSGFTAFNNSDLTNAAYLRILPSATEARFQSGITGTGTYLPLTMYTGGSERVRIDTSGNLGIGVSSPSQKLEVAGNIFINTSANPYLHIKTSGAGNNPYIRMTADTNYWDIQSTFSNATDDLFFMYNGSAKLTIDPTTGNIAQNGSVASSGVNLFIRNATDTGGDNTRYAGIQFQIGSDQGTAAIQAYRTNSASDYSTALTFLTKGVGVPATNPTEKMRLGADGQLMVGTTAGNSSAGGAHFTGPIVHGASGLYQQQLSINSGNTIQSLNLGVGYTPLLLQPLGSSIYINTTNSPTGTNGGCGFVPAGAYGVTRLLWSSNNTATVAVMAFDNPNGNVGSIGMSGSSTYYSTSSDYRLKENITPITGALAKVALLKPVNYKWKADGANGEGFIAHELAEVCPHAVIGEKDAVDDEGKIKSQSIDTSFLVATLTAAIQELKAIVDAQAVEIAALKAK